MYAIIEFLTLEEGGRQRPPSGDGTHPYSPLVCFLDPDEPLSAAWSLLVRKIEATSTEYCWTAEVNFLAEEAPQGSMRPNRRFELYEGAKCVARGRLLPPSE